MCGIAGFYNINPCSDGVFTSMRHRGSDGEGVYKDGALSLYHARLAIQDVVGGAQPMSLDSLTIVFNGEMKSAVWQLKTWSRVKSGSVGELIH